MSNSNHSPLASKEVKRVYLASQPLAYRQAGHGPPLLLLHGWGSSSRNWQTTLVELAENHTIYALDFPGYGESPPYKGNSNWEQLANLVIKFADALGIQQFDLNGHSFGAGVAAHIAANWPNRVRRLILTCFSTYRNELERRMIEQFLRQMGVSTTLWQPWMSLWEPWMALWQPWMVWMGGMSSIYEALAWRFFYQVPTDEHFLREGFADFLRMDGRTAIENASSASSPSLNLALAQIVTPTLVIGARQDMIMPPYGVDVVAQLVPNSHLVWIDRCGHIPMIEHPQEYHQIVSSFLNEQKF